MAYGMLIDLKKCVGCHACATACKGAHGTPPGVTRSRVERSFEGTYPDVRKTILPVLCNHCENAPCVEACPSGATTKREDGIVVIDKEVCIGCKACVSACPYGARYFYESETGYFGELNEYEQVSMRKICLRARSTNARSALTELMRAKARCRLASRHARRELEFSAILRR